MDTKGAKLLEAFREAVEKAVQEHLVSGRAEPVYRDGVMVAIKPKR